MRSASGRRIVRGRSAGRTGRFGRGGQSAAIGGGWPTPSLWIAVRVHKTFATPSLELRRPPIHLTGGKTRQSDSCAASRSAIFIGNDFRADAGCSARCWPAIVGGVWLTVQMEQPVDRAAHLQQKLTHPLFSPLRPTGSRCMTAITAAWWRTAVKTLARVCRVPEKVSPC